MKPTIYLDYFFLNVLEEKKKTFPDLLGKRSEEQLAFDIIVDFLFDGERIIEIFNYPETVKHDDIIRQFEQNHIDGKINLIIKSETSVKQNVLNKKISNPLSVFFFSHIEDEIFNNLRYAGFFCITKDNIDDFLKSNFFVNYIFNVAKDGNISNWDDLASLSHPFNNILIFDSFLFHNNYKNKPLYSETISKLIDNLLKANYCREIHIVFVYPKENITNKPSQTPVLKSIFEKVDITVKGLTKKVNFKTGIVKTPQKKPINHDRLIFTNYFVLFSGDSFHYFNKNKNSDTILNVCTIFDWKNFKNYLNQLKKLIKEIPECEKIGTETYKVGDCNSKLFYI